MSKKIDFLGFASKGLTISGKDHISELWLGDLTDEWGWIKDFVDMEILIEIDCYARDAARRLNEAKDLNANELIQEMISVHDYEAFYFWGLFSANKATWSRSEIHSAFLLIMQDRLNLSLVERHTLKALKALSTCTMLIIELPTDKKQKAHREVTSKGGTSRYKNMYGKDRAHFTSWYLENRSKYTFANGRLNRAKACKATEDSYPKLDTRTLIDWARGIDEQLDLDERKGTDTYAHMRNLLKE